MVVCPINYPCDDLVTPQISLDTIHNPDKEKSVKKWMGAPIFEIKTKPKDISKDEEQI